jgi:dihydrofolate reductase
LTDFREECRSTDAHAKSLNRHSNRQSANRKSAMTRPRLSLIVAMARNRVIGANNRIPWRLPDEQQLFKRLTMGHHIVMGRKTYESIGRLLPGRKTVVVTRRPDYAATGAVVAHSLQEALGAAAGDDEVFVIGGAELFREALPLADRLHLTIVDAAPAGDTFMPEFDASGWREVENHVHERDERHQHGYAYHLYERRR